MQLLSILILIGTIVFIVIDLTTDELDEDISRRILEYAPSDQTEKEDDSSEFFRKALTKISQNVASKSKNINEQKKILAEAGISTDEDTFLAHTSKKLTFAFVLGIIGVWLAAMPGDMTPMLRLGMLIILPVMGFRLPDMQVKTMAKKRGQEVTYTLPDAIDLLSVCVEAGLGLDSAIGRVAKEQETTAPILSYEFKRVGKDIVAGITRADALRGLSQRNSSQELRSFVGLLIQSDKLGTSISQSLKIYSETLRNRRKQKAEEQASKASIKMTIPLVLFILPATFIVILAPAALSMMETFMGSSLGG